MRDDALLSTALAMAVPLALADLRQRGGPREGDWAQARAFGERLACHGDAPLFRTDSAAARQEGRDTASMFNGLVRALAVLAYCPGGVTFQGLHWEATD